MDERPFCHLSAQGCDVLMLFDYREIAPAPDIFELAGAYAEVFLVAWSMGVWAGQRIFSGVADMLTAALAVNGTLCPIDDRFGIPVEIINGTLRNFSEESLAKLYRRMCRDKKSCQAFHENLPLRSLQNQKEELEALLAQCDCQTADASIYSAILVSDRDLIMPTAHQLSFWNSCTIRRLPGCHFPFHLWSSWDRFLCEAMQRSVEPPCGIDEGNL
jgi:biotin synthesis protein BioG